MSSNDVTYDDGALNIAMSHIVDLGSIANNIIFQFQPDGSKNKNHQLSTNKIEKSALSPFDDKRYLLTGSHQTLAHGHWKIPK